MFHVVFFYVVSKRTTVGKGFSARLNGSWPLRLVPNIPSPPQFFFFSSDDMFLSCRGVNLCFYCSSELVMTLFNFCLFLCHRSNILPTTLCLARYGESCVFCGTLALYLVKSQVVGPLDSPSPRYHFLVFFRGQQMFGVQVSSVRYKSNTWAKNNNDNVNHSNKYLAIIE